MANWTVTRQGRVAVVALDDGKASGHAIAAGCMLALACDVRVMARGAFKLGLNEVPGGLPLPAFGVELMRLAVSPQHLTRLALHGVMLNPDEALAHGLVEQLVDPS